MYPAPARKRFVMDSADFFHCWPLGLPKCAFRIFDGLSLNQSPMDLSFPVRVLWIALCLTQAALSAHPSIPDSLLTDYEKSGKTATPRLAETVAFCKKLQALSPYLRYETFGLSPEGRDLPVLIADAAQGFSPESSRKAGKIVLMVQACIHAGEPDGKDAGLMLMRDIALDSRYQQLLRQVVIVFIPIFNVDGHERFGPYNRINQDGPVEMGWRTTAQNLNLNRDYLKADAPEMQAWLKLYTAWMPDFFVDCHVTDGADYQYVLTYDLNSGGNMAPALSDWINLTYQPAMLQVMQEHDLPMFPYVQFRNWHDPRSGLLMGHAPPMLSQGYAGAHQRPGMLIETHMLKPYHQRVDATYELLLETVRYLGTHAAELKQKIAQADEWAQSPEFLHRKFGLSFTESHADSSTMAFKGFEYTADTSSLTGGLWFHYDRKIPATWQIKVFPHIIPQDSVSLPTAYLIPPAWSELARRLCLHGVKMHQLTVDTTVRCQFEYFEDPKFNTTPYEGRFKATYHLKDSSMMGFFPKGSYWISTLQPASALIAYALEPASPDSYAAWGFMNSCMEQKEYAESYVMEGLAREMLARDTKLKQEYERYWAKEKDLSQWEILNWFYQRSNWADARYKLYPIGRVMP